MHSQSAIHRRPIRTFLILKIAIMPDENMASIITPLTIKILYIRHTMIKNGGTDFKYKEGWKQMIDTGVKSRITVSIN